MFQTPGEPPTHPKPFFICGHCLNGTKPGNKCLGIMTKLIKKLSMNELYDVVYSSKGHIGCDIAPFWNQVNDNDITTMFNTQDVETIEKHKNEIEKFNNEQIIFLENINKMLDSDNDTSPAPTTSKARTEESEKKHVLRMDEASKKSAQEIRVGPSKAVEGKTFETNFGGRRKKRTRRRRKKTRKKKRRKKIRKKSRKKRKKKRRNKTRKRT